jgi:hypothetical protein
VKTPLKPTLVLTVVAVLVVLSVAPALNVGAVSSDSFSNPSVIPGSQAALNGPRVSAIKFPIYASDSASLGSVISGTNQIMDLQPAAYTDILDAESTNFLNVTTEYGGDFEYILFNNYTSSEPGWYLPFRQAIQELVNYTYLQSTVLNGIQGVATNNPLYPPKVWGAWTTSSPYEYPNSLVAANNSLKNDPQIAFSPANQPSSSNTIACNGSPGVWEYATKLGSGIPNGTYFEPRFITRPDHPQWFEFAQNLWQSAAKIGLCINLQQVVHFSNVYPIIYAQYSNNWDMYDGGSSFTSPFNPVSTLFFGYTADPGWTNPFDNTGHLYNATWESLLHDMFKYSTSNVTRAELDAQQMVYDITQEVPTINLWWDAVAIPSLNNLNGQYWSGYVDVPGFSTWSVGSNLITSLNVHQVNPSTGAVVVGGTFGVAQHEAPDDFNPFQATSVYDFDILNLLGYGEGPVIADPSDPAIGASPSGGIAGIIPWMLTQLPTATFNVNLTTPHGYNMVDGTVLRLNFMNNITFVDNVKLTAADYNFSLWYTDANGANTSDVNGPFANGMCSAPCWVKYAGASTADFTGTLPDLIDSVVNSTYTETVYLNGTSLLDYTTPSLFTVFPEHLWNGVNTTAVANDINPITNSVNGTLLISNMGPFYFGSYVTSQYTVLYRNPGYFRTDWRDWQIPATGSTTSLSFNLTSAGSPIPTTASVKAWLLQNGSPMSNTVTTLSASGGSWTGSMNTGGLSPGLYELIVNGTYTDSHGLAHEALQYWGLNVGGVTTSSSSTSSSSSSSASSTTTTTSGFNYTLVAVAVVVIVIIGGSVAYLMRRK